MVEIEAADLAAHKILKTAGVLNRHFDCLRSDQKLNFAAAAAWAATLQNFHFVAARLVHDEIPAHPIIQFGPVANGILVWLRLVTNG